MGDEFISQNPRLDRLYPLPLWDIYYQLGYVITTQELH